MDFIKTNSIPVLVLVAVLLIAGFITYNITTKGTSAQKEVDSSATLSATDETPYTDLDGNPFTFDSYTGKVRVVNSWASWCPFCVQELKDFQTLAQEYADQDVVVIVVNRKEPREKAKAFLKTLGPLDAIDFTIDLTDAFYKSIGGFSMPETVFYDADGNIVFHKRGFMNIDEMRTHTQEAIDAPNKTP